MMNGSQDFSVKIDEEWYAREYPDVALSGLSPAEHYRKYGILFGRSARPSPVERKDLPGGSIPESVSGLLADLKCNMKTVRVEKVVNNGKTAPLPADNQPRMADKSVQEKNRT
ncbi:hypothetical protein [Burkholderia multivorans]|uniref:hypothetical protein n=1 Tax=Burkholderia multivorans TaxID=87883 RepID=UPI000F4E649D|nr:hypothetical protein [Burkholderia multivorans]MCA8438478.1 hypothetical protein [Burkholderia multivorans]